MAARARARSDVAAPRLPDAMAVEQRLPFVGRRSELAVLAGRWDRVRAGGGAGLVSITGEAGVGKTRLCRQLAQTVVDEAGTVIFGRADQTIGYPYQPFVGALRSYRTGPAVIEPEGPDAAELVRLFPELREHRPALGAPSPGDSDTQRYPLFDAVAGWLRSIAEMEPVLLIVDDVMWATEPTLAMLRHVVAALASAPVLFAVTHRPAEASTVLTECLADLRRLATVHDVPLGGLQEHEVLEALQGLLEDRVPDERVASVASGCGDAPTATPCSAARSSPISSTAARSTGSSSPGPVRAPRSSCRCRGPWRTSSSDASAPCRARPARSSSWRRSSG